MGNAIAVMAGFVTPTGSFGVLFGDGSFVLEDGTRGRALPPGERIFSTDTIWYLDDGLIGVATYRGEFPQAPTGVSIFDTRELTEASRLEVLLGTQTFVLDMSGLVVLSRDGVISTDTSSASLQGLAHDEVYLLR